MFVSHLPTAASFLLAYIASQAENFSTDARLFVVWNKYVSSVVATYCAVPCGKDGISIIYMLIHFKSKHPPAKTMFFATTDCDGSISVKGHLRCWAWLFSKPPAPRTLAVVAAARIHAELITKQVVHQSTL
jgi:hypothetical protein